MKLVLLNDRVNFNYCWTFDQGSYFAKLIHEINWITRYWVLMYAIFNLVLHWSHSCHCQLFEKWSPFTMVQWDQYTNIFGRYLGVFDLPNLFQNFQKQVGTFLETITEFLGKVSKVLQFLATVLVQLILVYWYSIQKSSKGLELFFTI